MNLFSQLDSKGPHDPESAAAFDAAVTDVVTPHAAAGHLHWPEHGTIVWGKPDPASE